MHSFNQYISSVSSEINSGDLKRALQRIQNFVIDVHSEPLCTAKVFASKELDFLCQEIGQQVASQVLGTNNNHKNVSSNDVVFIASRLQISGGHTRVIEDFIRILPHKYKTIIVTEVPGRSDRALEEKLQNLGAKILWAPRGNLYKKLVWLQNQLLKVNPIDAYLFNHHEDAVAVAGFQILSNTNKFFYHHADHHLCLGVYLRDTQHIDFHAFGYNNCKLNLGLDSNNYLPLAAEDMGGRPFDDFMRDGTLTTCTAAGKNKLEIPHFVSYVDVIPDLLKATGGRHVHIGKLSMLARFKIKQNMRRLGVPPTAFVYFPWVASVWKALHAEHVDLFIASFPIVGGKTLVEVMGAGIPCVVHNHPTSRFLGGVDMVYPDAFSWRFPGELFDFCLKLDRTQLLAQATKSRTHYESYYSEKTLSQALVEGKVVTPPPIHPGIHNIDYLEFACDVNYQVSLRRLIVKTVYRYFKKLRAKIVSVTG